MLGVVACVLALVCKRMQQLPTMLGPAVQRRKNTTNKTLSVNHVSGPNNVGSAVQLDPTLLRHPSAITEQKKKLGVVGLKVWPGVNLIKLLHLYVFQLSHLWIHGFNKGNFDAGINSCSTGQTTSVDYTCKFCTQRTCSDKHVAVAHGHKFFDVFPCLNKFFFKHVIWRTKVASCSASKRQQGCCLGAVFFESDKKKP